MLLQVAQPEVERAGTNVCGRLAWTPDIFPCTCIFPHCPRLSLIPVGGIGPLPSLVTHVCQLGATTMVTSPYSNYKLTSWGIS